MRHAIVGGFGPVGRHVADTLGAEGISVTIVETNPVTVARQRALGRNVVHGSVADARALEAAGIRDACLLAITIPDVEASLDACAAARDLAPGVRLAVRANLLAEAMRARELGAETVTVAEIETAAAMARELSRPRETAGSCREGAD
jgi:CPA2 family monovalent cation:H+ antiporter-2